MRQPMPSHAPASSVNPSFAWSAVRRWASRLFAVALVVGAMGSCVDDEGDRGAYRRVGQPLDAFCTADVETVGLRDVETDYLPKVVACENGGADFAALQAQAISARSYLYYKMETSGSIAPDTSDQAYLCGREPSEEHYEAVRSTSGMVLMYDNDVVAAFYVAGAIPSDRVSCVYADGDRDPTGTEHYVTYNEGSSGDGLEQTTLGWVNPANTRNRGCKSQNGAHCLAEAGWAYPDILRFYYGEDIEIVQAEGACVEPTDPVDPGPAGCGVPVLADGETIVDEDSTCFDRSCETGDWWWDHAEGVGGASVTTYTIDGGERDCYGRWTLEVTEGGRYSIEAHAVDVANLSAQARYAVRHAEGTSDVVVSQRGANGWIALGDWTLDPEQAQWVELADNTGEPYTGESSTRVVFDALRVRPYAPGDPPDAGGGDEDVGPDAAPDVGEDADTGMGDDVTPDDDSGVGPDATVEPDTSSGEDASGTPDANTTPDLGAGDDVAPDVPSGGEGDSNTGGSGEGSGDDEGDSEGGESTPPTLAQNSSSYEEGCAVVSPVGSSKRGTALLWGVGLGLAVIATRRRRRVMP